MAKFWLFTAAALLIAAPASAELIRKESAHSVAETVDRFEAAAKKRDLTIFSRIDHAAGAKKVGQDLRPTVLLIFGSPAVGTPLIQAAQTMGLSLPLKVLAWQDAGGKVWIGYDAPADMAAAHSLPRDHPVIGRIAGALDALADAAAKR